MARIVSLEEAAAVIRSGETLIFNAFGSLGFPEPLAFAIGERFRKTGEPRNMRVIHNGGLGVWQEGRMVEHMSQKGMIQGTLGSHITPMLNICRQISDNEIEGYNFPMGVMSHLIRASAGGKPGILSRIGLHTFIDPRHGGGAMNARSKQKLVELMELDGEEYLFYKRIRPSLALLRGTTADPSGNISMEKEPLYGDAYSCALASRLNGGKVVVQVERLSGVPTDAREVKIPGILVDYIVVVPDQWQTMISRYNPAYTGALRVPWEDCDALVDQVKELSVQAGRKRERSALHEIIARRASLELIDGALVNLGIGIPEMIPQAAAEMKVGAKVTLTVEAGVIGGVPSAGLDFGASFNADMLMDMALIFDLYDGGMLDMTFVGAMQVDAVGNVNVSLAGDRVIGVGGFVNITQTARYVTYCFPFSAGGLSVSIHNDGLTVLKEGRYPKFCAQVDQISASARFALEQGQKVLYITERCVFDLTAEGIRVIEIAKGVDLEKDVIEKMPFCPLVSPDLKLMDAALFQEISAK
ncbi:MAG: hypothetical protein LBD04_06175 [Synergistaceae bacterium]|jgi:propionate CoA-transferase|nr:hypothetical protein [Synergistaceae bacterium]